MTVLLVRPSRNEIDSAALAVYGIECESDPYLTIEGIDNAAGASRMLDALVERSGESATATWLIITSSNALEFFERSVGANKFDQVFETDLAVSFAAIGEQTKSLLQTRGALSVLLPNVETSEALATELIKHQSGVAVIPMGSLALQTLPDALSAAGWTVVNEVVYTTEQVANVPASAAKVMRGEYEAVVLRSPSAAKAFAQFCGPTRLSVICAGATTAEAANALGLNVVAVSRSANPSSVAQTVATALGVTRA